MNVQFLLLLALTFFKAEAFPIKVFQINQQQTKDYEVYKNMLIQNLIVTTDNLKLILNLEREDTMYKTQDEENSITKFMNYNIAKSLSPFQYATTFKKDSQQKVNDNGNVQDGKKPKYDVPGVHKGKEVPVNSNNCVTKRSPEDIDKPTEYEIKVETEEEEDEKENYDDNKEVNKRESNEYSSIISSEENLLNNGNRDSLELDNNSDSEHKRNAKRQAEGGNPLPIPTGDGDTQMVMGTFQAVMRPMKLPSLG